MGVGCQGGSLAPVHSAESSWPGCYLRRFLSNPFTLCSLQRGPLELRNSAALASDMFTEIRQVATSVYGIISLLKNTPSAHAHFYRTRTVHAEIVEHVQKNIEQELHQTVDGVFHVRVGSAEKQVSASPNERTSERAGLGCLECPRSPDQAIPRVILG